jgi:hypothetical protein
MKTTKCALVISILAFVTLSYASDHGPWTIKITLKSALENPYLVRAMHEQLDRSFLQPDQPGPYVAKVNFRRVIYVISGTYKEWSAFFQMELNEPPVAKSSGNNARVKPIK